MEVLESRRLLSANSASLDGTPPNLSTTVISDSNTASIRGQVLVSEGLACHLPGGVEGVSQVTVRLLDFEGSVIDEALTDSTGKYGFNNLAPGIYALQELQPSQLASGSAHIGSGGGIVFDANLIGEIILTAESNLVGYNFCDHPTVIDPASLDPGLRSVAVHSAKDSEFDSAALVGIAQFATAELTAQRSEVLEDNVDKELPSSDGKPSTTVASALEFPASGGASRELDTSEKPSAAEEPLNLDKVFETLGIDLIFSQADHKKLPRHDAASSVATGEYEIETESEEVSAPGPRKVTSAANREDFGKADETPQRSGEHPHSVPQVAYRAAKSEHQEAQEKSIIVEEKSRNGTYC